LSSPLRVPVKGILAGERDLDRDAARYVVRVHRLKEGARIVLFDPEAATEADARLISTGRDEARVRVEPVRPGSRLPARRVALLQAIAKGEKMDAIVRDATELGATRVAPMITVRSIPERASGRARWLRVAVEAARQSGRGDIPEIADPAPFVRVIGDVHETLRVALVLDGAPALNVHVRQAVASMGEAIASIALAVGPEGGFDASESAALSRAGFVQASLAPFILRTETAATAALAVIADLRDGAPPGSSSH